MLEIVTEADIASPEEAYAFLTKLRTILRYLGVNSGDMEKGAMRCEPNISVRTADQAARYEYGAKVEVKNLNSSRQVRRRDCLRADLARPAPWKTGQREASQHGVGRKRTAHRPPAQQGKLWRTIASSSLICCRWW
ncbi:MAG: hypothetical protein R2856_22215 [Caldilineaceae bacterium]